jgi:hypothetical protein
MLSESIMSPTTTYSIKPVSNGYVFTREDYEQEKGWSSVQMVFKTYDEVLEYLTNNKF